MFEKKQKADTKKQKANSQKKIENLQKIQYTQKKST